MRAGRPTLWPVPPLRPPYWRLNAFGIACHLLLTGWLVCACSIKVMVEIVDDTLGWPPLVGLAMGLIGLVGIGWGRTHDYGED